MTASLPPASAGILMPHFTVEPHALQLSRPAPGQRLFKIMKAEHLLQSIQGNYLHFNRVNAYRDFRGADRDDGAELPLDEPVNRAARFVRAPDFSVSDHYRQSRARTYACCFSLENSPYIWENYGLGSSICQVGLEFDFGKLRERLNATMSSGVALMCGDSLYKNCLSIDYGKVIYVDRAVHRANLDGAANAILYTYLKDLRYREERELRVSLSAPGVGRFVHKDREAGEGHEIEFPESLQFPFNFREAFSDGTIVQIRITASPTEEAGLRDALSRLGIIARAP